MTWRDGSWDQFYIDAILLPGRVLKCDATVARDIEMVKEDGTDTPNTKDNGYTGGVVDLEMELWRASQAEQLGNILANVSPRQAGGLTSPHSIFHPITNVANIIRVYVEKYKLTMPKKGRMVIAFTLFEWFPEGSNTKSKQGNGTPGGGEGPGDGGDFGNGYVPPPDPENVGADFA
jgi:hypothetical protein